jgi:hypothetical protein
MASIQSEPLRRLARTLGIPLLGGAIWRGSYVPMDTTASAGGMQNLSYSPDFLPGSISVEVSLNYETAGVS